MCKIQRKMPHFPPIRAAMDGDDSNGAGVEIQMTLNSDIRFVVGPGSMALVVRRWDDDELSALSGCRQLTGGWQVLSCFTTVYSDIGSCRRPSPLSTLRTGTGATLNSCQDFCYLPNGRIYARKKFSGHFCVIVVINKLHLKFQIVAQVNAQYFLALTRTLVVG